MMNLKPIFAALLLSAIAFTGCRKANLDVDTSSGNGSASGEVSGVWAKGSIQMIKGDITIPAGKSLTIEEGVTVLMDTTAKPEIIVKGNLYSMGTAENPVKFTVNDAYKTPAKKFGKMWGGILAAPTCAELVLDHTILEYGGNTTSDASTSVKQGLYKAVAGENLPALWFSNINGKLIVVNSIVRNFQEDCTYIEGGQIIFANNVFYTTGVTGGEAMNFKSGCLADLGFNIVYSANTNAFKLSNSGDRNPQAHIIAYNNTMVNTGWRRPSAKGGSVWVENNVHAEIYNNLFANTRFGIKRDTKSPEDKRTVVSNNLYYGYDQLTVDQFQPSKDIVGGVNEIISKKAGDNDPKFVNYPESTPVLNADYNTAWDFHLQSGSPALGHGRTDFTRHHAAGITIAGVGVTYTSPDPANYIGAFGTK